MCRHTQGVGGVATLVPACPSERELRRPRTREALFGIAWGGPVTGATHTYLARQRTQRMNFHFTFPARLAPPLLRPFQVLPALMLVARCYWDSIPAHHAGRAGRDGPSQLSSSPHCDAKIMHPWHVGAVGPASSFMERHWNQNINWCHIMCSFSN